MKNYFVFKSKENVHFTINYCSFDSFDSPLLHHNKSRVALVVLYR